MAQTQSAGKTVQQEMQGIRFFIIFRMTCPVLRNESVKQFGTKRFFIYGAPFNMTQTHTLLLWVSTKLLGNRPISRHKCCHSERGCYTNTQDYANTTYLCHSERSEESFNEYLYKVFVRFFISHALYSK